MLSRAAYVITGVMVPTFRGSRGIEKYLGEKLKRCRKKILNCCMQTCVQQFKIFSARFACILFVSPLLNLFHRHCF